MANCPGCSGSGTPTKLNPAISKCDSCGGLFTTRTVGWPELFEFVNLNTMQADAGPRGAMYFDFTYAGPSLSGGQPHRTHGWADKVTRNVVQYG